MTRPVKDAFGGAPRLGCLLLLMAFGAGIALAISGCAPANQKLPAGEIPNIDLATPQDTSRTFLMLIQAELKAIALGDRAALRIIREREMQCVDTAAITTYLNQNLRQQSVLGKDPIEGMVNLWGATISYYTDIIEYDGAKEIRGTNPNLVTLRVPAHSKTGEAQIEVAILRGEDNKWRVTRVGFGGKAVDVQVASPQPVNAVPPPIAATTQPNSSPAAPSSVPTTGRSSGG